MTPIDIKKKRAEQRAIATQAIAGDASSKTTEIDYADMLEPVPDDGRTKKKGRGPSPHYQGLINAFLDKARSEGVEEYNVNLDKFRAASGKPGLSVASIRQGLRNNLLKTLDDDGRPLWETIQVSVDNKTGILTLKWREPTGSAD